MCRKQDRPDADLGESKLSAKDKEDDHLQMIKCSTDFD